MDKGRIEAWLKEQRDNGSFQQNTSNHYVRAFKAFCTWMVDDSRASASPLARLKGVTVTERKKRGILLADQMAHLIETTALGKPWPVTRTRSLTGRPRAMNYQFAFEAPIRPAAISQLRPLARHCHTAVRRPRERGAGWDRQPTRRSLARPRNHVGRPAGAIRPRAYVRQPAAAAIEVGLDEASTVVGHLDHHFSFAVAERQLH